MANKPRVKNQEIKEAIIRLNGNLSKVADAVGYTRDNVAKRVNASPDLKRAVLNSRNRKLDNVEDRAYDLAMDGNTRMIEIILKSSDRGYNEKSQTEHSGGINITVKYVDDD